MAQLDCFLFTMSIAPVLRQIIEAHNIEAIAWDVDGTLIVEDGGLHGHKGGFRKQLLDEHNTKEVIDALDVRHIIMSRNHLFHNGSMIHEEVSTFGFHGSVPDLFYELSVPKVVPNKRTLLIDDSINECLYALQHGAAVALHLKNWRNGVFGSIMSGGYEVMTASQAEAPPPASASSSGTSPGTSPGSRKTHSLPAAPSG